VTTDARKLHDVFAAWSVHKAHEPAERERMALVLRNAVERLDVDKERIVVAFRAEVMGQKKLTLPVAELSAIREGVVKKARQRLKIPVAYL
jgi:hypothetical protein